MTLFFKISNMYFSKQVLAFLNLFWCVYGFMKEALTGTLHDAVLNNFGGRDRGSNF